MGIYKIKGSPYYWYDFSIKGIRFRDSTKTDSRADALALEAAVRRQVLLGEHYKDEKQLSLTEAFAKYWQQRAQFTKSKDTIKAQIRHIMAYLKESTPLKNIGQDELLSYVAHCRGESYSRPGWKAHKKTTVATINRRLSTFQGMHNEARLTWGANVQNINFKKLKLKEPPPINNTLSKESVKKWMRTAPTHLRHFTMIAVYSGLRTANILSLKGSQINISRKYIETIGKGGKKIHAAIVDELLQYIIANDLHKQDYAITFQGKPVKSIRTTWNTHCKAMGLTGLRRHDLRHTCGTWIYEETGDLLAVKEHLHHSDIKTTLRYTHTKKDKQLKTLNKMPKLGLKQVRRVK